MRGESVKTVAINRVANKNLRLAVFAQAFFSCCVSTHEAFPMYVTLLLLFCDIRWGRSSLTLQKFVLAAVLSLSKLFRLLGEMLFAKVFVSLGNKI